MKNTNVIVWGWSEKIDCLPWGWWAALWRRGSELKSFIWGSVEKSLVRLGEQVKIWVQFFFLLWGSVENCLTVLAEAEL